MFNRIPNEEISYALQTGMGKKKEQPHSSFSINLLIYGLNCQKSMFERCENMIINAAVLRLVVCVRDVKNKTGMCSGTLLLLLDSNTHNLPATWTSVLSPA